MKINRLYMQNFRNHRASQADLGPVNIFLGKNNAGKSSVLAALEWGLTGRCGWTDRAGRGSADLVRHGDEKQATAAGKALQDLPKSSLLLDLQAAVARQGRPYLKPLAQALEKACS